MSWAAWEQGALRRRGAVCNGKLWSVIWVNVDDVTLKVMAKKQSTTQILQLLFLDFYPLQSVCIPITEKLFKSKETKFPYDWGRGYFKKFES